MVASDFAIKLLVLGREDVGKTSLIQAFVEGRHDPASVFSTIEDTYEACAEITPGRIETIQIAEVGGSVANAGLRQHQIRRAQGFILVYDITNNQSFHHVVQLRKEIEEVRGRTAPIFVVGNKTDQEAPKRAVFTDEVKSWALTQSVGLCEVSAKTGANVNQPFFEVARSVASTKITKRKVSIRSTLASVGGKG